MVLAALVLVVSEFAVLELAVLLLELEHAANAKAKIANQITINFENLFVLIYIPLVYSLIYKQNIVLKSRIINNFSRVVLTENINI
ncbi:hypothetical protein D3C77_500630 [compost metagenome]